MRIVRTSQAIAVPTALAQDSSLSFNARGILVWILSQQDGWTADADQIPVDANGPEAIQAGLKELQDAGYLTSGRAEA
jgi:hypothetical protein